jgi:hypothetical protein
LLTAALRHPRASRKEKADDNNCCQEIADPFQDSFFGARLVRSGASPAFFALARKSKAGRNGAMRKTRSLIIASACAVATTVWAAGYEDDYNALLKKYLTSDGAGVRYAAWKGNGSDVAALQKVVDTIANNPAPQGRNEQLALYINAYNAWILHEAIAKYPTKSVKDPLFTFFLLQRIKVAGEPMSFNHLEKDIIRAKFGEPRVHFALNCASHSCPPLNRQAFRGDELDQQFEKLATAFVNSEKGVKYSPEKNTGELSKIFDWYKDDFKGDGVIAFINKRRSTPLPNDVKTKYQDYDWGLNEAK